jgi:hypothetical protein
MPNDIPPLMSGTTADIDQNGKTYNILIWRPVDGISGYNIYRRKKTDSGMPKKSLNTVPVRSVTDCQELKAVIPENSPEWVMLSKALSSGIGKKDTYTPFTREIVSFPHKKEFVKKGNILRGPVKKPDLCDMINMGLSEEQSYLFNAMAMVNLKIRVARGLGYYDHNVTPNEYYIYELRGIDSDTGKETPLFENLELQAGKPRLPDPPIGVTASSGDQKVLLTWEKNSFAASYRVRRRETSSSNPELIHEEPIVYYITTGLDNEKLDTAKPGFLDFQRWNSQGDPVPHKEFGIDIYGPENYTTYFYEVASVDILGRPGSWSNSVSGYPVEKIPPSSPTDVKVESFKTLQGLAVSWRKVTRNTEGHPVDIQSYQIYRAEKPLDIENITPGVASPIHEIIPTPTDPQGITISWTDKDPSLIPEFGENTFYYRIGCKSMRNTLSPLSVVISGSVPDTKAPGPTNVTGAKGSKKFIRIYWNPNPEKETDLAGYQIYRSVCNKGLYENPKNTEGKLVEKTTYDFMLVGEVLLKEAREKLNATGQIYFDDNSVPPASPICYAYWVRAFDFSGNLYDGYDGYPTGKSEYACGRIIKDIPPPVPVITALSARNNAVQVRWIAPPYQDLCAFHVYRSASEGDPGQFIACIFNDGTVTDTPWKGIIPDCKDIPAIINPVSIEGSFTDTMAIAPDLVYWYRVTALDWVGNESEGGALLDIPASSTFTYSSDLPEKPGILPCVAPTGIECGLVVRWGPPFDLSSVRGFLVFRSGSQDGSYRQVSPLVKGNEFTDRSAFRNVTYWYRVQSVDMTGTLSVPSDPVVHNY